MESIKRRMAAIVLAVITLMIPLNGLAAEYIDDSYLDEYAMALSQFSKWKNAGVISEQDYTSFVSKIENSHNALLQNGASYYGISWGMFSSHYYNFTNLSEFIDPDRPYYADFFGVSDYLSEVNYLLDTLPGNAGFTDSSWYSDYKGKMYYISAVGTSISCINDYLQNQSSYGYNDTRKQEIEDIKSMIVASYNSVKVKGSEYFDCDYWDLQSLYNDFNYTYLAEGYGSTGISASYEVLYDFALTLPYFLIEDTEPETPPEETEPESGGNESGIIEGSGAVIATTFSHVITNILTAIAKILPLVLILLGLTLLVAYSIRWFKRLSGAGNGGR